MTSFPTVQAPLGMTLALCFAWKKANELEAAKGDLWKRVAYATRYGKGCTLTEVMNLPVEHLSNYITALDQIVEEENRPTK